MDKKLFAQRLKSQRELLGLTQKELAAILKITERGYQYYEALSGFKPPTFNLLFAIAEALDISIDYLFGRTANPKISK